MKDKTILYILVPSFENVVFFFKEVSVVDVNIVHITVLDSTPLQSSISVLCFDRSNGNISIS